MREFLDKFYNWFKGNSVPPWILIGLCFWWAWPAGIFLLLMKLDVIDPRKWFTSSSGVNRSGVGSMDAERRKEKYIVVSHGMTSVSIDYLAKVVGVDFATTMRDVQEMVISGAFGPQAYIDYDRRWLIKSATAAATTTQTQQTGQTAEKPKEQKGQTASQKPKTQTAAKTQSKSAKKETLLEQVYGKQTWLLVLGIILAAIGGIATLSALDDLTYLSSAMELIFPVCMLLTGGALIGTRFTRKKRVRRFASYIPIIGDRASVTFAELGSALGVKESTVRKDLEIMIEKKLLDEGAYIDVGAGKLILRHEETEEPVDEEPKDRYSAVIAEIRQLNDDIADPEVSAKIDEIEKLTKKIFQVVEDKPEKLPEIKSFMSYYLPTTLKLLRSYSDFERQGVSGENIDATKERIEKILDTLVSGFSQQLDQLFRSDAMDISSDIDVLETMMQKDGLSKDESGFGVAQAGV